MSKKSWNPRLPSIVTFLLKRMYVQEGVLWGLDWHWLSFTGKKQQQQVEKDGMEKIELLFVQQEHSRPKRIKERRSGTIKERSWRGFWAQEAGCELSSLRCYSLMCRKMGEGLFYKSLSDLIIRVLWHSLVSCISHAASSAHLKSSYVFMVSVPETFIWISTHLCLFARTCHCAYTHLGGVLWSMCLILICQFHVNFIINTSINLRFPVL